MEVMTQTYLYPGSAQPKNKNVSPIDPKKAKPTSLWWQKS